MCKSVRLFIKIEIKRNDSKLRLARTIIAAVTDYDGFSNLVKKDRKIKFKNGIPRVF